jgi:type II secretory pathway pseudopilin PulG
MSFCSNCGKMLEPGKFCPYCGQAVDNDQIASVNGQIKQPVSNPNQTVSQLLVSDARLGSNQPQGPYAGPNPGQPQSSFPGPITSQNPWPVPGQPQGSQPGLRKKVILCSIACICFIIFFMICFSLPNIIHYFQEKKDTEIALRNISLFQEEYNLMTNSGDSSDNKITENQNNKNDSSNIEISDNQNNKNDSSNIEISENQKNKNDSSNIKLTEKQKDGEVILALNNIINAQRLYYKDYDVYTSSYEDLAKYSLIKNNNINYGQIFLKDEEVFYEFTISHKLSNSKLFRYDSWNNEYNDYEIIDNATLTSSVW